MEMEHWLQMHQVEVLRIIHLVRAQNFLKN